MQNYPIVQSRCDLYEHLKNRCPVGDDVTEEALVYPASSIHKTKVCLVHIKRAQKFACILAQELLMGFQDVAFLQPELVFSTIFVEDCGRGDTLRTITRCPKTVVGGKQGHAPCKILSLQQNRFVSVKYHGDH